MTICKSDRCVGCGVCSTVCPHKAIRMTENTEGFLFPSIDSSLCVSCEACRRVCPVNKSSVPTRLPTPLCFGGSAKSQAEVATSTSGGIASVFARHVIRNGGVVIGAAFDPFPRVAHIVVESEEDLDLLKGSKYVESDITGVLPRIREFLKQNRKVLFVGLPCHVAALYGFLGEDDDNLVTIDLVCHGKPPQKLFSRWAKELERTVAGKITRYQFRNKDECRWNSPETHHHHYQLSNGHCGVVSSESNWYSRYFLGGAVFRRSCYQCQFAKMPRVGDLTLADFWGAEQDVRYARFADRGLSLVTAQSSKGRSFLLDAPGLDIVECKPSFATACNGGLTRCTKPQVYRNFIYYFIYWPTPLRRIADKVMFTAGKIARRFIGRK